MLLFLHLNAETLDPPGEVDNYQLPLNITLPEVTVSHVSSYIANPPVRTGSGKLRLDSIDVLRGLAALMVAFFHIWGHYGQYPFPSAGIVHQTANPTIFSYIVSPFRWGFLGVSLFLVLSGFCIHLPFARRKALTGSYAFEGRKFYLRRFWRLYPAYAISILSTLVLILLGDRLFKIPLTFPTVWDIFSHLTFLHGFVEGSFYSITSVYWSLALEVQLYLAFPVFLILFRRLGITRAVLLLTALALFLRFYFIVFLGYGVVSISAVGPFALLGSALARMPEWLFGAWLAEQYCRHPKELPASKISLLGLVAISLFLLAVLTTLSTRTLFLTDPIFGLAFATVVYAVINKPLRRGTEQLFDRRPRYWVELGVMSYSLYLFHLQISWIYNAYLNHFDSPILAFLIRIVALGVSIFLIRFVYLAVERPFLTKPPEGSRLAYWYTLLAKMVGIEKDVQSSVSLTEPVAKNSVPPV